MMQPLAVFFEFTDGFTFAMLVTAALLGGLVRGFTGFGFAMVFVPIATMAVGPVAAAALIWLIDIPFAWALAARRFGHVTWREVFPLLIGAMICVPLGVWLLTHSDPVMARWAVAIAIVCGVTALASGWRYRGMPGTLLSLGVGGMAGVASGLAQLGGMPIAIFWLAAQNNDPRQTRDNLNGFFSVLPVVSGFFFWWAGMLTWTSLWQALPLCVPYGLGLLLGSVMFPIASEQTFRRLAYAVIALAALLAMPIIDPLLGR